MPSDKKIQASRCNTRLSTGPKTPEGKAAPTLKITEQNTHDPLLSHCCWGDLA